MRWTAAAAIGVLVLYHAMRVAAAGCTGGGCDLYIPLSLALPLAAIVLVGITGVLGFIATRATAGWRVAMAVTAALGVAGPPVAVAVWRDSPDVVVVVATFLIVLCPVCVLGYSTLVRRPV